MQRAHFQVCVGVFSCQQILTEISFVIFDIVVKKTNRMSFSVALVKFHWFGTCFFLSIRMQKLLLVYYYSAKSRCKPNLESTSKYEFFPRFGRSGREKMAAFRAYACKLSWTPLFARPGSAPILGGKKGEFRDWLCNSFRKSLFVDVVQVTLPC